MGEVLEGLGLLALTFVCLASVPLPLFLHALVGHVLKDLSD
jgi:hypothetical protein